MFSMPRFCSSTAKMVEPGSGRTATKEDFADVLRRADEEMQWLIGATLALLVGITLAVVLLVSWMCVLSELFHDFRQSVLILWDILLRRDPCYRVLCHLACDTSLKVPDYEWYLLWKSGEVDGQAAMNPSSSLPQCLPGKSSDIF
ncbi:uncharacterized protein LOC142814094 [Rhipicephalus microplus]|uniref:uncharacterized protein LOC142814094 n=1 Tax=Rhipicephalus microplus TaxID=6941 RepID=UPI003F6C9B10